jgi:uncharacterized protein YjbJ (UPF0337 family)
MAPQMVPNRAVKLSVCQTLEKTTVSFSGTIPSSSRCPPEAVGSFASAQPKPNIREKKRSRSMNWDRVEGNWKQVTGKVKEQWGKLTDDDLTQINGNREQLEGKIQARYGYAKDQVRKEVDDWISRM